MIGLKKRDMKTILKAGSKARGVSISEFRAEIQATIDEAMNSTNPEVRQNSKNTLETEHLHQKNIFTQLQKR